MRRKIIQESGQYWIVEICPEPKQYNDERSQRSFRYGPYMTPHEASDEYLKIYEEIYRDPDATVIPY